MSSFPAKGCRKIHGIDYLNTSCKSASLYLAHYLILIAQNTYIKLIKIFQNTLKFKSETKLLYGCPVSVV